MNSWNDRVASKLSRLLSDSAPLPHIDTGSSPSPRPSKPQALAFAEDEISSQNGSTFSSFLISLKPATYSGAGQAVSFSSHDPKVSPSRSHSRGWKSSSVSFKDRPLDNAVDGENESSGDLPAVTTETNANYISERSAIAAQGAEVLSFSNGSAEFLPYLMEKSTFGSANLFDFLQSCLPNIVKGCQWVLLYSTMKHGISLRTLIHRSSSLAGPYLLIVGDMQGAVFGGLLDSALKPTFKRKYQGTNQTFVFTTTYGEPRLFRATGANRYYHFCLNDILAFGGGGSFALALEEDLLHGTSGPSETFGNLCLAHTEEFELKNVELWGFTHSSRYHLM